jgi:membrane fusion protein, heavy metal efflux system
MLGNRTGNPLMRNKSFFYLSHPKKQKGLVFASCIALSVFLFGCEKEHPQPQKVTRIPVNMRVTLTEAQERNIGLSVGTVHPVELTDWVECNGQIQTIESKKVQVFSPAPGRITGLSATLGQFVHEDQMIANIKSDEIGQLESDLLQQTLSGEADLRQAGAQIELSQGTYKREHELLKEEVSSKADFEAARIQYKKDQSNREAIRFKNAASIQSLRDRLSLFGVSPQTISHVIRSRRIYPFLSIYAPNTGIVTERNVNMGELIDSSKALVTISDLEDVWLVGSIYEKDIQKVKRGQPIRATVDSLPNRTFTGHVNFISNLLDSNTRTLSVTGILPNPKLLLKPNMFARMSIEVGRYTALSIPIGAVQTIGDSQIVYVQVSPNTFEERRITLGHQNDTFVEVKSGLAEGEKIAVTGTVELKGVIIRKRGEMVGGSNP